MNFSVMSKNSRQLFVGKGSALFGVDWRKKDFLVSFYRDKERREKYHWMSDPNSKSIWCESEG